MASVDRSVVWLHGEHDISTVAAVSKTLAAAIAAGDADVVVDLSDVDFMGAATVGVIIRARELMRLQSRSLVVRDPSRSATRVIELCGLVELLNVRGVQRKPAAGIVALPTWVEVPATGRSA